MNKGLVDNSISLQPGTQLQFLRYMLMGQSPQGLIDNMDAAEISHVYDFMWEKALEIGIRVRGEKFSQADMIKRLKTVEQYKAEVGCKEPLQRCVNNECIDQNASCVRAKLKDQFNKLYGLIADYLGIEYRL
jgi:hypothetical protein